MPYTDQPHAKAAWRRPIAYRSALADQRRLPRPVLLRSSCGHVLGVGYIWRKQGFITVRTCR